MNTSTKRLSAFNYFGGKSRYLDWLLPLLHVPAHHYVEPFCGSAVVFLNKIPHPIETINDLDGRLINFFRVLREQPDKLIALLHDNRPADEIIKKFSSKYTLIYCDPP